MMAQVFWRYFLELPLTWSEEIARYLFIIVTYIGASIAVYEKSHIEINITDSIINHFNKENKSVVKINLYIDIIRNIFIFLISLFFSYYCYFYAVEDYTFEQVSTSVGLPLYLVSGSIFLCMVIIVFYSLSHVIISSRDLILYKED
jgi:TRAP-type C4-dicarboxylate transport system permease small subunit